MKDSVVAVTTLCNRDSSSRPTAGEVKAEYRRVPGAQHAPVLEGLLVDEAVEHVEGSSRLVGGHHVACALQKGEHQN